MSKWLITRSSKKRKNLDLNQVEIRYAAVALPRSGVRYLSKREAAKVFAADSRA